jgi:hypothetical protein
MNRREALFVLAMLLPGAADVRAGAELVLVDGQVLSGSDVERTREGLYILTTTDGEVIPVPVDLVKKLVLTGGEEPAPTGFKLAVAENLVGPPEPFEPPRTREQLSAFGRAPARFREGAVDFNWTPGNALKPDVTEFNPVRWYKAPTNFIWEPKSAFTRSDDVTQFNPVNWRKAPTDPVWWPKDGFRRPATKWFAK